MLKCLATYTDVVDVLAIHHEVIAARARSIHLNLLKVPANATEPKVRIHDLNCPVPSAATRSDLR